MVQWLRLHTLNAGGTDVIPGQGTRGFLCDSAVKNLSAMQEPQETWVQPLDLEDPLKEGMAIHSSVLAWRIPMDRGAWRATVHGVAKGQTRLSG